MLFLSSSTRLKHSLLDEEEMTDYLDKEIERCLAAGGYLADLIERAREQGRQEVRDLLKPKPIPRVQDFVFSRLYNDHRRFPDTCYEVYDRGDNGINRYLGTVTRRWGSITWSASTVLGSTFAEEFRNRPIAAQHLLEHLERMK